MDTSLEWKIVVGQRRCTSGHHTVGGEEEDRNNHGRTRWRTSWGAETWKRTWQKIDIFGVWENNNNNKNKIPKLRSFGMKTKSGSKTQNSKENYRDHKCNFLWLLLYLKWIHMETNLEIKKENWKNWILNYQIQWLQINRMQLTHALMIMLHYHSVEQRDNG